MLPSSPRITAKLEEIGLYNMLTRIVQGQSDVDPFVLATLREKGFVGAETLSLTDLGLQTLQGLTVQLGWFYPEV
jgi:hypothetical protein